MWKVKTLTARSSGRSYFNDGYSKCEVISVLEFQS
jgi:hypothetical protein